MWKRFARYNLRSPQLHAFNFYCITSYCYTICITYICLTLLRSVILFLIRPANFLMSFVSVTLIHLFLAYCAPFACSKIPVEHFTENAHHKNDEMNEIQFPEENEIKIKYGYKQEIITEMK